jgi:hypothetical protein
MYVGIVAAGSMSAPFPNTLINGQVSVSRVTISYLIGFSDKGRCVGNATSSHVTGHLN